MGLRDLKYIPSTGEALTFDAGSGFAINPVLPVNSNNAIAFAGSYRNQVITAVGTGTVIVYGSTQKDPPDFTKPSTIGNSYAPIMLADYTTPNTYYAGGAGVVVSSSTKIVELNTNLLTWIAIHRSATTVGVKLTETDNQ